MTPQEKVNILLVDDQPARLLSYEAILGNLGQNIVRAGSGAEALKSLMRDEFAVILLDVNMPGMDGFETAQMIHQHPRYEKTPIVFVTGFHVTDMDRLKGYELGAVDYVYLPVVPEILRGKVTVLIELYVKKRELVRLNANLALANAELALANSTLQAEKTRELEAANAELERTNASLTAQIAERRRAEEAQRRSEERLQTILQNTSALIYQIDTQGRFVHVNRQWEELFGIPNAEMSGKTIAELFPEAMARNFLSNNLRVLAEGRPLEFEEAAELPDGMRLYSSIKAPLIDEAGQAYGIVGVSTDITERKRLEIALKDADRRKDEFIAMLAHELRNPLAPIVNGLELMRLKTPADPEFVWCRDVIGRQVSHMCRLIEDLLDVSRITQGKIKLQLEHVEVAAIVARAVETIKPLIDTHRHELTVELPDHPVLVDGDPTRLVQVVGNLLSNAAKYTQDGGHIRVTLTSDEGTAEIRVKDDGVGLAPEILPKLFELFSQFEPTLNRSQGGLGIGLALVRRLAELHGGEAIAQSEGLGKGSEFIVRLPRLAADARPTTPNSYSDVPASALARGWRVLVVDDNVDSADSLSLVLRRSGHRVKTAHSGADAVMTAQAFVPHVVLLDLGMPGMNGYEAAQRIRQQPGGSDILLIALTGWSQSDAREATRRAGFNLHLVKPVDLSALQKLLEALPDAKHPVR